MELTDLAATLSQQAQRRREHKFGPRTCYQPMGAAPRDYPRTHGLHEPNQDAERRGHMMPVTSSFRRSRKNGALRKESYGP